MNDEHTPKMDLLGRLLEQYTLKEIVGIFSNIDEKIMSLHQCSSNDFLNFNSQLKDYNLQVKIISENASQIFELIAGSESHAVVQEFNNFHEKLKLHVDYFEKQLNYSIAKLSQILNSLSYMYVPLKNFMQNLLTLKFLIANMKLNVSYDHSSESKSFDAELKQLDELIDRIKTIYPTIEKEISLLKVFIRDTLTRLHNINKNNELNVEQILNQIYSNVNFLSNKHEEALLQVPKLSQKTNNCYTGISKIITNLQYHDIIRQKMQHIQEAHKELIRELNLMEENQNDQIVLFKQAKYASQIPAIAQLQIAQLLYTNKEYQRAIQVITSKFDEIGSEMKEISDMCFQIASHTHKSEETHFHEIQEKLNEAVVLLNAFVKSNKDFGIEVEMIYSAINRASEFFIQVSDLDDSLLLISKHIAHASVSSFSDGIKFSDQIKQLSIDIRMNINKIEYLFDQVKMLNEEHFNNTSDYNEQANISESSKKMSENVMMILDQINQKNVRVVGFLEQNRRSSEDMSLKISTSVENVKYYDFFEKNIEEIILELNDIYESLATDSQYLHQSDKKDLKTIEKFYTMQSEREIHDQVSSLDADSLITPEQLLDKAEKEIEEEDNIEFF